MKIKGKLFREERGTKDVDKEEGGEGREHWEEYGCRRRTLG